MPDQLFTKIQLTDESMAWYKNGIYPVIGTQTGTKSGAWTGNIDVPELYDGLTIAYFLPIAGNGNATLKLTLSTGAETDAVPVYVTGTTQATTHYAAGSTIILTYWSAGSIQISGTTTTTARWSHADYFISNTNTSYTLYHQSSTWKAYTILYRYQLLLQKNETSLLPINTTSNSTATTKTLTTESFNPFGVIRYYNTTTTVSADANIAAAQLYEQQAINLGYSFNTGTTLTSGQDVYIVAVPQSDGMAKLDSNPISQTLPTTEDGKIYIYLGHAYSTSNIELYPVHPIYWFKDGKLQFYTGDNVYTSTEKTKLANIAAGAEVNQNAFSNVAVGSTTIAAGSKTDTLTLTAGSNVTLTPDATNNSVTIVATDTTYTNATTSSAGLMSSSDKEKLDGLTDAMQFKGTLGTGGTITALPAAAASNKGYTYKVVTAGTYSGTAAKVGDLFISNGSEWSLVPSGDEGEDTWRAINVNGSSFLGNGISTSTLNLSAGTNISLGTNSNGTVTISGTNTNTNRQLNLYYDSSAHTVVSSTDVSTPLTFSAGTNVSINGNSNGTFTFSATNTNREIKMVYDGSTYTIVGSTDTSPITFLPGSNVTLDGNTSNKTITINATNTARATSTNSFVTSSSFSWSAGTTPTLGSAITVDDITSWSQGTLPTVTLSEAILTFSAGTLPSITYSEKSVPNVTSVGTAPSLSWSAASAVTSVGT